MDSWSLSVTMLEIYNDQIYCLMGEGGKKVSLKFGGKEGVEIVGAESQDEVVSEAELLAVLSRGSERRR